MLFLLPHKGDGIKNQNPHPPDDNASSDALLGYVEKPVKYKYIRGKNQFLVKWMGCPDNTWEPKKQDAKRNASNAPALTSLHCLVLPFHPTFSLTNITLMLV